jgi:alpha-1,3-glucan synthase
MAPMKLLFSFLLATLAQGLHYDPSEIDYNLNTNKKATNPLEYSGARKNHDYWPSPDNWRMPFYTLFLDRYANGDPSNDDINGTVYEQDITSNQLRHGGDLQGLVDSLDYIQGMGVKVCSAFYTYSLTHVARSIS